MFNLSLILILILKSFVNTGPDDFLNATYYHLSSKIVEHFNYGAV